MIFVDPVEAQVRMLRAGIKVRGVAQHLGVSHTTAYRFITARRPVPPSRVAGLLELIGPQRGLFARGVPHG